MRVPQIDLVASVVPLAIAACTASSPPADTTADIAAIRHVIAAYEQGLNTADLDECVSMYANDAVFMPNEGSPQVGLAAIRNYYEQTTLASRFDATFTTTDIQVSGDVAWATVAIAGRQTPPGGVAASFESKGLFLFRRAPSGSWQVVRYIFNPNAPPPTSSP